MSTYESAVQGRRDFREAYRQEREKHTSLRESHAALLAAANEAQAVLQGLIDEVTGHQITWTTAQTKCWHSLTAAIAKAEELGK